MTTAPIAFFAYKRPEHTRRALESLSLCELADKSTLFIFCDGPKRPEDREGVRQVRELVTSRKWCGTVEIIAREENAGLAGSIVSGVTRLCDQYGRVIVLEDDLIVASCFLRYMNDALERYQNEERVMQISGFMFDVDLEADTDDAIFLPYTTSWGWGTWQRAWRKFDHELRGYQILKNNKEMRQSFNLDGRFDYFSMLERRIAGRIDSWAIQWYLSVFICNGLVLHPVRSMVVNEGFDGTGTHCGMLPPDRRRIPGASDCGGFRFPQAIAESSLKRQVYASVFGVRSASLIRRVVEKFSRLLNLSRSR